MKKCIKNIINNGRAITEIPNGVLWNREMTRKKLRIVKSAVKYGTETW